MPEKVTALEEDLSWVCLSQASYRGPHLPGKMLLPEEEIIEELRAHIPMN
jgi:hypothetical protein